MRLIWKNKLSFLETPWRVDDHNGAPPNVWQRCSATCFLCSIRVGAAIKNFVVLACVYRCAHANI